MNPALPRIYLVRHGETAWTITAQHTGRTDLPLTDRGQQQARSLSSSLATLHIDRIISSPLQRAHCTAELAMPHSHIMTDDDLMEWDYGVYEGRSTKDIELEHPGWRLYIDGSPGGETLLAVADRADRVIRRIRETGGNVMLFGHSEILRIFAILWIGLKPVEGRRLLLSTGSLSILGYDHDLTEPVIHQWNAPNLAE